jgi:hypothetical protein
MVVDRRSVVLIETTTPRQAVTFPVLNALFADGFARLALHFEVRSFSSNLPAIATPSALSKIEHTTRLVAFFCSHNEFVAVRETVRVHFPPDKTITAQLPFKIRNGVGSVLLVF